MVGVVLLCPSNLCVETEGFSDPFQVTNKPGSAAQFATSCQLWAFYLDH